MNYYNLNDLKNINLIEGDENFLKEEQVKILKNGLETSYQDMNLDILSKDDLSYEKVEEISETLPFMDERRLIFVEDLDLSRNKMSQLNFFLDPFLEYMDHFPETTSIVFVAKDKAFKGKFYKKIEKIGCVLSFQKLDTRELSNFISNRFKEENLKTTPPIIDKIIEYSQYLDKELNKSLIDLNNELDKLFNIGEEITIDLVEEVFSTAYDTNIFKLMDSISEKNKTLFLRTFQSLILGQKDLFQVFYMMVRQIRNLLFVKEFTRRHISQKLAEKDLKMSSFEFNKLRKVVHLWTFQELMEALHLAYETDLKIKSTPIADEVLIENFVLNLF